jgi:signal recognition particle subunit SRP54
MLENITKSVSSILDSIAGKRQISENDLEKTLREIRVALLEADVSLPIAKEIIARIKQKSLGEEVIKKTSPHQMIVKIVNDEVREILGSEKSEIIAKVGNLTIVMMVGLQGSGKTTTTGKLAKLFAKKGKKVLLSSLDIRRPAAQEQLKILADRVGVSSVEIIKNQTVKEITNRSLSQAKSQNYDLLFLDTAGRNHIDEELMNELIEVKKIASPNYTELVADCLLGQQAVNIANSFKDAVGIDGVIMTRMDGDGRGGAVISMKMATGCPIHYVGVGEGVDDLEDFDPERVASRIIGMGDIVSLVEKAQEVIDQKDLEKAEKSLQEGNFDFNDLASQFRNMKKMGGLGKIIGFIPGMSRIEDKLKNSGFDEKDLARKQAIISSMTPKERSNPSMINFSRKTRIVKGSGTSIRDIVQLIKKLKQMRKMMKKMKDMDEDQIKGMMQGLNSGSGLH